MKKNTKVKNKKLNKIIYFLFTILIVLSSIYIMNFFSLEQEAKEQSKLLNTINIYREYQQEGAEKVAQNISEDEEEKIESEAEEKGETITTENTDEQNEETERMLQVKQLQEQNPDIVGWLEITNTNINYPVLQGTDNSYYMTHNYKKENSKNGSIFLDANYNWNIPSNNLLIYGHNLGNGMMFQELLKYEQESFYQEHPVIRFTTAKEDTELIQISVSDENPTYATKIANEIANVFKEKIAGEIYKIDNVHIVDQAEVESEPSNVNHMKDIVIFAFIGAVVAVMYVLIANMLDTTVKTQEDIEKIIKMPVLACVPIYDMEMEKLKKKSKGGRRK